MHVIANTNQVLPRFSNPPVVETVLGVQFQDIERFRNEHLWAFWEEIREEYPNTEDQEPLGRIVELFGTDSIRGRLPPRIHVRPHASRLQAITADARRMLQFQNGRFVFNWRRVGGAGYPGWIDRLNEFDRNYRRFCALIEARAQTAIVPDQWEVTYVNHIMKDTDWDSPADWAGLLPRVVGDASAISVGEFESVDSRLQIVLPEERGRLHVELNKAHLVSNPDQELLVLKLTTRGEVSESRPLADGLEIGHRAIVLAFFEIIGDEWRKRWGYQCDE